MTDRKARAMARAKAKSRFPSGMTDRKARATAEAKATADSCGMTDRKAKAEADPPPAAKDDKPKGSGLQTGEGEPVDW